MPDKHNITILKNTVFLYLRTFFLLVLGLFTSRITMQALGVENYGIINVVGGFVSMFALISGSLTAECQRFITFELGKENGNVQSVFSATFFIHIILAVVVLILAETAGLYFVNSKLNLPSNKMMEVQWVFQCSVISFILNLINIPYNALIVAHEKMKSFAYISIVEGILKFLTVYSILIFPYNSLILYSCLSLASSIIVRFIYQIYCRKSFKNEATVSYTRDKSSFKQIFDFAGWAFMGNTATLLNNQGLNIILNIFVGVTVNAARGISSMVETTISGFVNNFTTALNPQITKSYAQDNKERLSELLDMGMRLSFFLMIVMSIPIIIVTPDVLKIWLVIYPDYAISFIRITLIIAIIQAMANPFITAVCATGDIKGYQLVAGGITLINVPVCYLLLMIGFEPISVYVSSLIVFSITFFIRLWYVRNKVLIPVGGFLKLLTFKLIPIGIASLLISYLVSRGIDTTSFLGLLIFALVSCTLIIIVIFFCGLKKDERSSVVRYVQTKFRKVDK